jgi:hypothetical protein
MEPTSAPEPRPAPKPLASPRLRVDELALFIRRSTPNGVRMELRPPRPVTATDPHVLPMFEGWIPAAELVVRASGVADGPFAAALDAAGTTPGTPLAASTTPLDGGRVAFTLELAVPLRALTSFAGSPLALSLLAVPGLVPPAPQGPLDKHARRLPLVKLTLIGINGHGPHLAALDPRRSPTAGSAPTTRPRSSPRTPPAAPAAAARTPS